MPELLIQLAPYAEKVMRFIIGTPHKVMGVAFLLAGVNIVVTSFRDKAFRKPVREGFEKMFAYLAFIIIGNVLDSLAIDQLFGWKGSTQFLVCLYIVAKEIRTIANYLTEKYGISIPILNERLDQMERGQTNPGANWSDPNSRAHLDQRISDLQNQLNELERQQQAARQPVQRDVIPNDPGNDIPG